MTVKRTTDSAFLRRWMLRQSFVAKMGGVPAGVDLYMAFDAILASGAVFFGVWEGEEEKGCIIFARIEGGWDLHLCLATWWTKTRVALRLAMAELSEAGKKVLAAYDANRRAVDLLLNDIGFSSGYVRDGKRFRQFTFNLAPSCLG